MGVTIRNVASYSALLDAKVDVRGIGTVTFDLAYGGHFYALVEAAPVGLELSPAAAARIVDAGERIRGAIEAAIELRHPEGEQSRGLLYIQFYGPARRPDAHLRNAVVVAPAALDRSPCGTGTSSRMAQWAAKGKLKVGDDFVHESIIGTLFRGRVEAAAKVGEHDAIIPSIEGWARMTGYNTIFIDDRDPLAHGFQLADKA
jgi:4-hydroxyproline epimerase